MSSSSPESIKFISKQVDQGVDENLASAPITAGAILVYCRSLIRPSLEDLNIYVNLVRDKMLLF